MFLTKVAVKHTYIFFLEYRAVY